MPKHGKTRILVEWLSKTDLWVHFSFFHYLCFFFNQTAREARLLPSLSPFIFFKLVCILAIPNNSRMLLHLKLIKIRFWKREKNSNSILISLCEQTQPLTVKKKGFQLTCTLVAVWSKKNRIRFFGSWTKKKAYQHWYFFSLKKDYSQVFSPCVLVNGEKSLEKETIL